MLHDWKVEMKMAVLKQNSTPDFPHDNGESDVGQVAPLSCKLQGSDPIVSALTAETSLAAVAPCKLKTDQLRAFEIIEWHLEQTLAGTSPPPLRMIIYGEGGTGKSQVIQTVTEAFRAKDVEYMLVKSAYTGVAASLINGKTTHTLASLSLNKDGFLSDEGKAKLQQMWRHKRYMIIDEYSMIGKTFLALLSRNISIAKEGSDSHRTGHSFGGVNVVLCGDLHQFPPVAQAAAESLYHPNRTTADSIDRQLGRLIYEEFSTVVILKEQMRVTDLVWQDLLHHLRHGHVQEHHIDTLRSLILSNPNAAVDFASEPWSSAALVTPRHAVRKRWNEAATRQRCAASGERMFVCTAEDSVGARPLSWAERYAVAGRGKQERKRKRKDLPWKVELARGMKILVTDNVETDLDVTNGARGELVDIVLHPEEPPLGNEPIVHLKYLPAYLLVKLERTRAARLEGLEENVIPVEPAKCTMRISVKNSRGKWIPRTVQRKQYPITAAYAFTDYRAQGQTLSKVLVDIASPPFGHLNLFNLYVSLSRSSGRASIRLLRNFDPQLFRQSHDMNLMTEDDRLERLNRSTLSWWQRMQGVRGEE